MTDPYHGYLIRLEYSDKQTLGILMLFNGLHKIFECKTLELPYIKQDPQNSCLASGSYHVRPRFTPALNHHFAIFKNPSTETSLHYLSLITTGNFHNEAKKGILIGQAHLDIDHDGYSDVTSSHKTMQLLLAIVPREFPLLITSLHE